MAWLRIYKEIGLMMMIIVVLLLQIWSVCVLKCCKGEKMLKFLGMSHMLFSFRIFSYNYQVRLNWTKFKALMAQENPAKSIHNDIQEKHLVSFPNHFCLYVLSKVLYMSHLIHICSSYCDNTDGHKLILNNKQTYPHMNVFIQKKQSRMMVINKFIFKVNVLDDVWFLFYFLLYMPYFYLQLEHNGFHTCIYICRLLPSIQKEDGQFG